MTSKRFYIIVGAITALPFGAAIFADRYMSSMYQKQLALSQEDASAPLSGDAWTLPLREEYARNQKDAEKASVELDLEVKSLGAEVSRLKENALATKKALTSLDRRLVSIEHTMQSLAHNDYVGGDGPVHVAPNANAPTPWVVDSRSTPPKNCDKKTLSGCCFTWKNGFGDAIPVGCPTEAK